MRLCHATASLIALATAALVFPATSAAAAIDDFTMPGTLAFSTRPSLSNDGFTVQAGEPGAAASCPAMGHTGWWRIAGTGQRFTITTAGSNFDTVLAAYDSPGAPTAANRVACNDDTAATTRTSTIEFDTVRGRSYLVQVGGLGNTSGVILLSADAPRPGNDDRAGSLVVPANESRSVDSTGASTEPEELLACGDDHYGATVWFRFSAPAIGDATFSASGNFPNAPNRGDTVMTVYQAANGAVLGCNDDAGAGAGSSQVALRVGPGDYLVQVGGHRFAVADAGEGVVSLRVDFAEDLDLDRDGSGRPADCNDADPAIRPGAPEVLDNARDENCDGIIGINLDRDGDGSLREGAQAIDCDDTRPDIHPGAKDIPRDGINQDCAGGDADYPLLSSTISGNLRGHGRYDTFTSLRVRNPRAGSTVRLRCLRTCRFKTVKLTVRRNGRRLPLKRHVRGLRLRRKSVFEVRVTQPGYIGVVKRWKFKSLANPTTRDLCIRPRGRPGRCPG